MSVIRFILTAAFMLVGLFVCCVGVYGVFKLKYAANRMHGAALNDTLGVSFCLIGLASSAPEIMMPSTTPRGLLPNRRKIPREMSLPRSVSRKA